MIAGTHTYYTQYMLHVVWHGMYWTVNIQFFAFVDFHRCIVAFQMRHTVGQRLLHTWMWCPLLETLSYCTRFIAVWFYHSLTSWTGWPHIADRTRKTTNCSRGINLHLLIDHVIVVRDGGNGNWNRGREGGGGEREKQRSSNKSEKAGRGNKMCKRG